MKGFHAYDIRGIYNKEFGKEEVYKIGYFLPGLLNAKKVLIGRDVRISSPEIFEYLTKGIMDAGADVDDAGLATTPMIYWGTAKFGYQASVMITASHNSKEYNGLKVSGANARPIGYDNGLKIIEQYIINDQPIHPVTLKGKINPIEIIADYLNFQKQYLSDLTGLNIAIDCSNGMAGLLIRDILGDGAIYLNETPDGTFPNHEPNPLVMENVKQLQEAVLQNRCDIGAIYDGDADRVMFIDERGAFIPPDLIIALLGHFFLEQKNQKGLVIQDIRSSKSVGEYLEKLGGNMYTWKVGRAYAANKLKEIDGIYGGELAGHYYFKDFYYSDSGIMASLIVFGLLQGFKKSGKNLSTLINKIRNYANSGELNFRIEHKQKAMDRVVEWAMKSHRPTAYYDFDGYRIEFDSWWFNLRPSNTEPYLRLLVEAKSEKELNQKVSEIKSILKPFM
jgi:phosphomannomutase